MRYRCGRDGAGCEVPYRDRDRRGTCTLLAGDVVSFNIATDRRDKLQRATNVELLEESFEADARETVRAWSPITCLEVVCTFPLIDTLFLACSPYRIAQLFLWQLLAFCHRLTD